MPVTYTHETVEELCFLLVRAGQSLAFISVVSRWPAGSGVSAKPEEYPLLEAVTRNRLVDSVTD
jgi:hypothetical protein